MTEQAKKILPHVDHTLLKQDATWDQVREIIDDAVRCGTASVCISPCFVKQAKEYAGGRMPICTVIGFPNGVHTTAVKVFETQEAVRDGADGLFRGGLLPLHPCHALPGGDDGEKAGRTRKAPGRTQCPPDAHDGGGPAGSGDRLAFPGRRGRDSLLRHFR